MRISIVTVCYNSERYIAETFDSILNQKYKNIEYIVVDGASKDRTLEIIKEYENKFLNEDIDFKWISEKDNGMYDALKKGFKMSTGEVMGWINSDDILFPHATQTLNHVFSSSENIQWITGFPSGINHDSSLIHLRFLVPIYSRKYIEKGYYHGKCLGSIQQESTFWSRKLWDKVEIPFEDKYRLTGDYHLWRKFAKYENLYTVNAQIGAFREHPNQQTSEIERYYDEIKVYGRFIKRIRKIINFYHMVSLRKKNGIVINNYKNRNFI